MSRNSPAPHAAACRWGTRGGKTQLETWSHSMTVGEPLPTVPLWLSEQIVVPLDLEQS